MKCPPECPFFPFGFNAYDLWFKVDESWGRKTSEFVLKHLGQARFNQLLQAFPRVHQLSEEDFMLAYMHALYTALFVERDSSGRTLTDIWEAAGWTGLNNDERVMMSYRRHSYVTVIEVQKVLPDQSLSCVDLLAPGSPPLIVYDRSLSFQMARYTRLLAWITPYPHYSRIGGMGVIIQTHLWLLWKKAVGIRYARESSENSGLTLRDFLARNFYWCTDLITQLNLEYSHMVFEQSDFVHCVGFYRLKTEYQQVDDLLRNRPEFASMPPEATPGFDKPLAQYKWLLSGELAGLDQSSPSPDPAPSTPGDQDQNVLGYIRLYQDRLILEVLSKKRYELARPILERLLGEFVEFEEESLYDLAEKERSKIPRAKLSPEAAEVLKEEFARQSHRRTLNVSADLLDPPKSKDSENESGDGTEPTNDSQSELESKFRRLLDKRIPVLGGHTPRESTRDETLRPHLIEWVKGHIQERDMLNLENGTHLSLDWMLDELGLAELK